ncbi:MAG: glucose-1-phosphate adenylyltransferase [Armatimonadota bacterium]|nr:glucose-1-phosphate adenylyltransferase [Armatimonadota bacterium]
MPKQPRILAFVLAGGRGERLFPLTRDRSKPAVPFGGKYRIIDFVLSNLLNSGIYSIYVLVQYLSQSLIDHIRLGWRSTGMVGDHFVLIVPPQMRRGETWYRGTADAIYQNLNLIRDFNPDLVAVFGADHIYRMDVSQMVAFHLERAAQVTVAALPVPLEEASNFGILTTDRHGRIIGFEEKPKTPQPIPSEPSRAYASMGNYLFDRRTLIEAVTEDALKNSEHDFGRNIIPDLVGQAEVYAYNFLTNEVPGLRPYEEHGYWRDVGTIRAYWQAHMDLLGPEPLFDLDNPSWPIYTYAYPGPSARVISGEVEDSLLGEGALIRGGKVRRSILGRGVRVEEDAVVEDSIVMDFTVVDRGVHLRRVIVDRFNHIEPGTRIGLDPESDAPRYFVDGSGIVVIPRGRARA